jgi:hypothetical protein
LASCVGRADETLTAEFLLLGAWAESSCDRADSDGYQFALMEVPGWRLGNRLAVVTYRSPLLGLPDPEANADSEGER